MNKISKILFCILIILSFSYVKAECTSDEINKLKKEADKITITYEHLGEIEEGDFLITNEFEVTIENIPDDVYINVLTLGNVTPENSTAIIHLYTGNNTLDFYSKKCNEKIYSKKFKLPKYNPYFKDSLCEGIDGNDFALCGKYYDSDIDYEDFELRVKNYRTTHKIDEKIKKSKKNNDSVEKSIIEKTFNYIIKNKVNLSILLGTIAMIIILIMLLKRKKKRGVLE